MRNIKTIVFDLGRVLVDIDASGRKFSALMRALGVPPDEAFARFWYTPEVRKHMTGELDSRAFHRIAVERYGLSFSYEEFAEGWCDLFRPQPEMREVFEEAAGRYRVGILSDTDPLHWAKILEIMPWLSAVEKPTLSFEVGCLKPHPQMFASAAANSGCEKEECLFIDDLIENVDGARFCGMPAVHFSNARKLRKDLAGVGLF